MNTVAITGGSKGIGASIAHSFIEQGWQVLIGARNDNGLAEELGAKALFYPMDVCQQQDHLGFAQKAVEWTGKLDAYINCAGCSDWRPIGDVDESFWIQMIDTNLKGALWGCQAAAKLLSDKGSIVNVSSLAGKRGSANNSVYCAAKFGVNGITQSLAKELGPRGIRVNAVCPVYVETPGLLMALENPLSPAKGQPISEYLEQFAAEQSALKRLPKGDDVANLCSFLASPSAQAITGQCINVDCGVLPQ
jgi:NAD(P)-dependent dehydrogenase (short-subunit alcohol dehydrogenase family)